MPDEPETNRVFLSYAEEDSKVALRLVAALRKHDIDVRHWQEATRGSTRWISEIEMEIHRATAFIAVLSLHYLSSYWCRAESHLALRTEERLYRDLPEVSFVLTVAVADAEEAFTGFLGDRNAVDLVGGGVESAAAVLAEQIRNDNSKLGTPMDANTTNQVLSPTSWPSFQNRQREIDLLTSNITNPGGKHFWTIVAGPKMGKSWLLDELVRRLGPDWEGEPKYLDLRQQDSNLLNNGERLLLQLFGRSGDSMDERILRSIEAQISASKRPWLLMLDSVEWLEDGAARTFRHWISRLYQELADLRPDGVSLAVVVAGRNRNRAWKGVSPKPELSRMVLTRFTPHVVVDSLMAMVEVDGHSRQPAWCKENGLRLHRLSEGLPALLIKYMEKLREWACVRPVDLELADTFAELATPYVKNQLFSEEALGLSRAQNPIEDIGAQREALKQALSHLCTCRIFTASHIRHAISEDSELAESLSTLRWSEDDLRRRLHSTHLLKANDDLWAELDPAIRRLLFRYSHSAFATQAQAHQSAESFYNSDWPIPTGKEQVVMLVEKLWHRAEATWLGRSGEGETEFLEFSRRLLDRDLVTDGYRRGEYFHYLEERLTEDDELQESLQRIVDGLFDRLLELVAERASRGSE